MSLSTAHQTGPQRSLYQDLMDQIRQIDDTQTRLGVPHHILMDEATERALVTEYQRNAQYPELMANYASGNLASFMGMEVRRLQPGDPAAYMVTLPPWAQGGVAPNAARQAAHAAQVAAMNAAMNAVTPGSLATGSITAGKISAGAITAQSIFGSKIVSPGVGGLFGNMSAGQPSFLDDDFVLLPTWWDKIEDFVFKRTPGIMAVWFAHMAAMIIMIVSIKGPHTPAWVAIGLSSMFVSIMTAALILCQLLKMSREVKRVRVMYYMDTGKQA